MTRRPQRRGDAAAGQGGGAAPAASRRPGVPASGRWLYRLATTAALAGGALALPALAVLRPRWLLGLGERLGAGPAADGNPVWLHAASVGEVRLALPLARELAARGATIRLTTTTTSGRDLARREMSAAASALAPLDHPLPVSRALRRLHPSALVLVETELWPELLGAVQARGIPTVLVNARLSDRSWRRYQRLRRWLAPLLGRIDAVLARSEQDRERWIALGCRPQSCRSAGDLKAAALIERPAAPLRARPPWVLVGGSLHRGEFARYVELLRRTAGLPLAHVVAPRHLEHLAELRTRLARAGLAHELWSQHRPRFPEPAPALVLVDTIGDLGALYAAGDLAFVGGSLDAGAAGHNLLEPAAAGRPVLFGPGVAEQRAPASALLAAGAGVQVADVAQLQAELARLTAEPGALHAAGSQALEVARAAREAGLESLCTAVELILRLSAPGRPADAVPAGCGAAPS